MENEIINDEMNCNGKLPNSRRNDAIFMVVASGLMTALITIATMTVKVPIPDTLLPLNTIKSAMSFILFAFFEILNLSFACTLFFIASIDTF